MRGCLAFPLRVMCYDGENQKHMAHKKETSWQREAHWYEAYLEGRDDTYQRTVILPNILRVLDIHAGDIVLDLACGQGFFSREFAKAGARVTGVDVSKALIALAKKKDTRAISYHVARAEHMPFLAGACFDTVVCILALQNIPHMRETCREVGRVLSPRGTFVMVLNHPAFRAPRFSSWGWDEERRLQYRRIDRYLSAYDVAIDMHPGKRIGARNTHTVSYHRSLQDIVKALAVNDFAITKLEEWISHKTSDRGPRKKAEDVARKEFPLFLMLEARLLT